MNIRNAQEIDLAKIIEIYNNSIPSRLATADTQPISVESRLDWYKKHTPNHYPLWVIEIEKTIPPTAQKSIEIAGWLGFQPFYGRPAYHKTAEISLYISPPYHRQGMGQKLLSHGIEKSPNLGIKNLLGFIFSHNQPSLNLFKKNGFQEWGYLPKVAEMDGIERDLAILGYTITD
ncbi:MAG TPA: N-acetyltransferase [Cyanobacteria bacterium UBA11149]|nr:N-acetyltransferase [Cyanobacteria bacterium UBA11367]HBE57472.1 N-acetyltransferase [Cyanobacteria bacterium UBA11366]HBK62613.1 N-acetyltransferase [Cyanobacteria bacterium UBA11166]HBR75783.1 N-acetyltransferase [Cyanobacteria bacterium UBA11159]HBS69908.1 N-acetyltransferase [Cyanobacteria bacterium UBA11153]HBW89316.1 N-acetyltransferase [Cyanobacteria bacterium UBA11149]HCA93237.1 N-acetyltransferase [Cyanobacteria bacterium UBA9226]